MKVVFLDIDGVLNHMKMAEAMDRQHAERGCPNTYAMRHNPNASCTCYQLAKQIDPECVARLNTLLERTGAVVVLSTSWRRLFEIETIDHVLREHGFTGKIVGATPDLPNDGKWLASWRAKGTPDDGPYYDRVERGHEIEEWILRQSENGMETFDPEDYSSCRYCDHDASNCTRHEVEAFVILDDCSDMARVKSCLVQTDDMHGLDDQDVSIAETIMLARSPKVLAEIREEAA